MNARMLLLSLCLAGCTLGRGGEVATLGRVDDRALPGSGNWFLAASPSILRYRPSRHLEADTQAAIAHYEAVAKAAVDDDGRAEALRRAAYLRLQLAEETPDVSRAELERAVAHYQSLLQATPDDPHGDRILYQLARAWQALGDPDAASNRLRALQRGFPASPLLGDATFRLAEIQFSRGDYAQASEAYERVLADPAAARFVEMAQYKLGWSAFRQGRFASAVEQFLVALAREMPPSPGYDPEQLLRQLEPGRRPWVKDALRVISLSLAAEGGAAAWPRYFPETASEPDFAPLLYTALGELMLEKRHFTAAAAAFASYPQRHPQAQAAPHFARRQIDSLDLGGFSAAKIDAMMSFADRYAPDAAYWEGRPLPQHWRDVWLADVDALAAHYHHQAQRAEAASRPSARNDYLAAARWYQRRLQQLPSARGAARSQLLLAEALQAAGLEAQAIAHFERAAYDDPGFEAAPDAAYAGLLLRLLQAEKTPRELPAALLAADRLTATFADHPHWTEVVLHALEERVVLEQWDVVVAQARRLLQRTLSPQVRDQALTIMADAQFALEDYAAAESAYRQLMQARGAAATPAVANNLALAVYRQGEAARSRGLLAEASGHFLRLGEMLPEAGLRTTAEFDAAAVLLQMDEWAQGQGVLEGLLQRDPDHALAAEARRKLAAVYERRGLTLAAAALYVAIADASPDADLGREALWHASQLYLVQGASGQAQALLTRG